MSDETSQVAPAYQSDAVMSRRSFVKSAAAAAVLGTASPQVLMAETKEPMPLRALGRTGEKVSAIGLGGYHIGKQADEAGSITIIVPNMAPDRLKRISGFACARKCESDASSRRPLCETCL